MTRLLEILVGLALLAVVAGIPLVLFGGALVTFLAGLAAFPALFPVTTAIIAAAIGFAGWRAWRARRRRGP